MMTEIHAQPVKNIFIDNKNCINHTNSTANSNDDTDDGPLSKKHATDKRIQDKKKEKLLKEKKRILKRL